MKTNESSKSVAEVIKAAVDSAVSRLPYTSPRLVPAAAFGSINGPSISPIGIVTRRLLQTGSF